MIKERVVAATARKKSVVKEERSLRLEKKSQISLWAPLMLTGKFKRSEHDPELLLAPGNDKSPILICPDAQVGQSPGATVAFSGTPRH
jgi:hypothetical protein